MLFDKRYIMGLLTGIAVVLVLHTVINNFGLLGNASGVYTEIEDKLKEINNVIGQKYVHEYSGGELKEGIYSGFVRGLDDPYSYYMDKEMLNDFIKKTEGNYVGIGIVIQADKVDKQVNVISVFKNSPAEKAGIKVGDKVIKVDDTEIGLKNYTDIASILKGKEGTEALITVYRKETNELIDLKVLRQSIDIPTVDSKMLEDNIGYIQITNFDVVTEKQFFEAYKALNDMGMERLILDLRNNPGGLLNVVVKIADAFVPEGVITYTEDKDGNKEYEKSDKKFFGKPLVVLVNSNSASASEVLSGAIKDFGVGKLVGTTTYGKGVVQNLFQLSDGSALKLTIAKYYTPSGVCIDGIGIKPDYEIKANTLTGKDVQLEKAVEVVKSLK